MSNIVSKVGELLEAARLPVTVASGDIFDVRHFDIREGISSLFEITLDAVSLNESVDFDEVVGHPSTFTVGYGIRERTWTGVVSGLELARTPTETDGLTSYRLRISPNLWLTTQRRNYRMFQQMSEPEIVKKLLDEWEIEHTFQLASEYKKRKYRVQYAESDFSFMSRLLEDVGISYFFKIEEGKSKMILTDNPERATPRAEPVPFRDQAPEVSYEHATKLVLGQRVRPGKYTIRDHDYRLSPKFKLASSADGQNVPVESKLERYHYVPGSFLFNNTQGADSPVADDRGKTRMNLDDGNRITKRRLEAKRGAAKVIAFDTTAYDLAPGVVTAFLDHPHPQMAVDNLWLISAIHWQGDHDKRWLVLCEARSAAIPFRPALVTPKPTVNGVESATVVGADGDEIHTDEFGRVRVHFHWDRESQFNEQSSCWIHVSQPWGGTAYGGMNLPRVGQEVLVDFLGGDPDRPIIVGRVYTNLEKVPYQLPAHKTRSAWKTNSSPGGEGFNEIMFEDQKGQELVFEQAEKNRRRLVKDNEVITIGNNFAKLVKSNYIATTNANRTEITNQNRTERTDMNKFQMIGQALTKLIGGTEDKRTIGDTKRMIDANSDEVVGKTETKKIGENMNLNIGKLKNELIGQIRSLIVGGDDNVKVGGKHALDAGKEIHLKSGQKFVLEAGAKLSIKGPGGFIDIHSGGIDIVGNLVRINSGGSPADGSGSTPTKPEDAKQANPPTPSPPQMDDVGESGIGQGAPIANDTANADGSLDPSSLGIGSVFQKAMQAMWESEKSSTGNLVSSLTPPPPTAPKP